MWIFLHIYFPLWSFFLDFKLRKLFHFTFRLINPQSLDTFRLFFCHSSQLSCTFVCSNGKNGWNETTWQKLFQFFLCITQLFATFSSRRVSHYSRFVATNNHNLLFTLPCIPFSKQEMNQQITVGGGASMFFYFHLTF